MNLQTRYDLEVAEDEIARKVEREEIILRCHFANRPWQWFSTLRKKWNQTAP